MNPEQREAYLTRIYRRSHSENSRHTVEMARRAFDKETHQVRSVDSLASSSPFRGYPFV